MLNGAELRGLCWGFSGPVHVGEEQKQGECGGLGAVQTTPFWDHISALSRADFTSHWAGTANVYDCRWKRMVFTELYKGLLLRVWLQKTPTWYFVLGAVNCALVKCVQCWLLLRNVLFLCTINSTGASSRTTMKHLGWSMPLRLPWNTKLGCTFSGLEDSIRKLHFSHEINALWRKLCTGSLIVLPHQTVWCTWKKVNSGN